MPNLLTRVSILVLLICLFTSASAKAATPPGQGAAGSGTARVVPAPDTLSRKLIATSSTGQMLAVDSSGAGMAVLDKTGSDPRKTASNGLSLVGSFSFSTGASGTRMTVDHIINTRSSGTSGSLRLELWATTTVPVFGDTITHFTLGSFNLNPLQAGFEYNNVDTGFVIFTPPPAGCYYITVALLEFDSGTYFYEDLDTASGGGVADGSGFDLFSYGGANCSAAGCIRDNSTACLLNGRFQVTVTYRTSSTSGNAQVMNFSSARAESDESAFFWFFDSSNFEMGLKMLDACSVNSRFWVYISGLTDQGWTATIFDTQTGVSAVYQNNVGHLSSTVADTGTLRCP